MNHRNDIQNTEIKSRNKAMRNLNRGMGFLIFSAGVLVCVTSVTLDNINSARN